MINLYKTGGVITVGEDGKVPVTYYGRGGKSGKFYPVKNGDILLVIGGDYYTINWADLIVEDVSPYSQASAISLLEQFFSGLPVQLIPEFISPILLFDFYQDTQYADGNTSIADLSGNGNNGTPTEGTGNGNPESINNSGVAYNPTAKTMDFSSNAGNQHSISLPDYFKFGGTTNYTITLWFKRSAIPGTGDYQGLVASQGNDGGYIGMTTLFMNPAGTPALGHTRQNGSGGVYDDANIYFGTGGVQPFVTDTWYMVSFGYDGTNMFTSLYEPSGNRVDLSVLSTAVVLTSPYWSAFLGLRYNNWLDETSIGVLAIHDTWIGTIDTDIIYNTTKDRYGY